MQTELQAAQPDRIITPSRIAEIRRNWRIVFVTTVVAFAGVALFSLLQTPQYRGQALVLVDSADVSTGIAPSDVESQEVVTQTLVAESQPVARAVITALGLKNTQTPSTLVKHVSVQEVGDSRVLRITVEWDSPSQAADVANAFANQYLAYRLKQEQKALDARSATTGHKLTAAPGGVLLTPAVPASSPDGPNPIFLAIIGGLFGLLLGIGLALLRGRFDDSIRDEETLIEIDDDLSVLGSIPRYSDSQSAGVVTLSEPFSRVSDAYRAVGAHVRFLLATSDSPGRPSKSGRTMVITSASRGDGKTTVASNVAVAAAHANLRVILVDANLRNPSVARRLNVDTSPGLSEVLEGDTATVPILPVRGVTGLSVVPAGTASPNPAKLLASHDMRAILDELSGLCDLVIIDSAPVLGFADTLELVRLTDMTLLVARSQSSRKRTVGAALRQIRDLGGTIAGTVLNEATRLSRNASRMDRVGPRPSDSSREGRASERL